MGVAFSLKATVTPLWMLQSTGEQESDHLDGPGTSSWMLTLTATYLISTYLI